MTTLDKAREAAIDHGMWLAPDDDETNYQAFVAGYLRGYVDRGVEATNARDEQDAEIASLRAKLAAVPNKEIQWAANFLRVTGTSPLAKDIANAIDRWLAGLAK